MKEPRTAPGPEVRDGFFFLGNQLALDFLNTRPVLNGKPTELLADFKALLRWFRAAGLLAAAEANTLQRRWGASVRTRQIVEEVRRLREQLRKQVIDWECGKPIQAALIAELNRQMRDHPMRTRLSSDGSGPATELWFEARKPEDLFAPLAYSAALLFSEDNRDRVRKCANCVLHFHDTSKKGTRRWCSMQFCGNRAKVAAYADRQRRRARMTESRF